jgi:hypothetical protein
MPSFESLLKEKNERLESIPLELQTVVQKQQREVLNNVLSKLSKLTTVNGQYKIDAQNIRIISEISDDLKKVFLNDEYLKAVKNFSKEFEIQATLNSRLIDKGFGETANPVASEIYIQTAKRNAVEALVGSPIDSQFIKPIQGLLEQAVVNGATVNETIDSIRTFVEGGNGVEGKILKYAKQITNDSFAIADRSYTSIVSDYLGNDWFYYAGSEVENTRCFCAERVGKYFHYKEVEGWANGENLDDCNIGGGKWAGMIPGTNSATIYSYLGGYQCLHSLIPVSEAIVPDSDIERAKNLGFI